MGFRFQKRFKIAPGGSINLSKSGISTSFGSRGAKVTYGHGRRRTTVGIPGTGISHTESSPAGGVSITTIIVVLAVLAFLSYF